MVIILLWALFVARLAYSAVGAIAPAVLASGPLVVLISIPAVFVGVWIGTKIYNAWPNAYKTVETSSLPKSQLILTAIALPLLYLLWPLLVVVPSSGLIAGLALILIPCAIKQMRKERIAHP